MTFVVAFVALSFLAWFVKHPTEAPFMIGALLILSPFAAVTALFLGWTP